MEFDSLFFMALQASLILGAIHGINPCGHSWLVLAPFVSGNKNGRQVVNLTFSFILGTASACLVIGWSLGAVSLMISNEFRFWTDILANIIIIILGAILLIKPEILHYHDHSHDHHSHEHDSHSHCAVGHGHYHTGKSEKKEKKYNFSLAGRVTATGLFTIGFFNMIVPCPTAAMMYSYALESASVWRSITVFAVYALSTGITVSVVIFGIYKINGLIRRLNKSWIEGAFMRVVGLLTIVFGTYSTLPGH